MSHDQIFKELLRLFFGEFITLFLPDIARRLDFSSVTFLDQENFADFPDGGALRSDVAAEVRVREQGGDSPAIIHILIEIEGRRTRQFPARMWEYYSVWRLRRERRVYPIVIYLSPGTGGIVHEEYTEDLLGERLLTFRYAAIGLPDLSEEEYRESDNPLAVALSATMKPGSLTRLRRKLDALRRIARSSLEDKQRGMLATVVESYLKLNPAETAEFRQQTQAEPEVQKMLNVYEERGIEIGKRQGRQEGRREGMQQGRQEALLLVLTAKFGPLPEGVAERVSQLSAPEVEALLKRAAVAETLTAVGLTS